MISKYCSRHEGFTLVEVLIGMSLTVLVGGVLYLLQSTGLASVGRGTTSLSMHSEIRRRTEIIISDLHCAQEVLDVSASSLRVLRYALPKEDDEDDFYGEKALVVVEYKLEKEENQPYRLWRTQGVESPAKILEADHIAMGLFKPFYESGDMTNPETSTLEPFDYEINDSEQRKRICYMQLRLEVRQNREFTSIATAVTLRPAQSRLIQPNWNFR